VIEGFSEQDENNNATIKKRLILMK
jgi:hypothetical protein